MAVLIDTSVLIRLERRGLPLAALRETEALIGQELSVATITVSELLVGVHRATSAAIRTRRETRIEALLERLRVVDFDLRIAKIHAQLFAELQSIGQLIGAHDLIIAATALALGDAVLTHNRREFDRVPGLVVVQPDW